MKKKIFILITLILLFIPVVYAVGNDDAGSNKTVSQQAAEKRVTIRSQSQQLVQLRTQLKTKLKEQTTLLQQYRAKESLTVEERAQVKATIQNIKTSRQKLGQAYQNAVQTMNGFKSDGSEGKLTGLDSVIQSQKTRINLLQECINIF